MAKEEPSLVGTITEGPTPDEHGNVTFKVRVGDQVAIAVANPRGIGWQGEIGIEKNLALVNATMAAVQGFVKAHKDGMLQLYRAAARLRRDKGNLPQAGNTRRGLFGLYGPPTRAGKSVRFTARSVGTKIVILIFR